MPMRPTFFSVPGKDFRVFGEIGGEEQPPSPGRPISNPVRGGGFMGQCHRPGDSEEQTGWQRMARLFAGLIG